MKIILVLLFIGSAALADENPFAAFIGTFEVVGGECMRNTQTVPCDLKSVNVMVVDDVYYLKEYANAGGASFELFKRDKKSFEHWDVAEFGGTAPDFAFWRRNLSEKSGHIQTVVRQFTRKGDSLEYVLTFYEKESLNGARVTINNKYILR